MPAATKTKFETQLYHELLNDSANVPNMLLRHYQLIGLEADDVVALMQVVGAHPRNKRYFSFNDLTAYYDGGENQARRTIALLLQKRLIIRWDEEDTYSLQPMYDKLLEILVFLHVNGDDKKPAKRVRKSSIGELYEAFEKELARPLSAMESRRINEWLSVDGWPADMVKEALRRAVMHGTCNLMYIDKILESWRKKGINSLQQAYEENNRKTKATAVRVSTPQKNKNQFMAEGTDYDAILNKKR